MVSFGLALILLVGVLEFGVVRSHELAAGDPVRILAIVVLGVMLLAGIALVALPDRLVLRDDRLQLRTCGLIPGKAYKVASFKGLWVDFPARNLDLEFASGRRFPFFQHADPFVIYEKARELSRALKLFVRHDEVKLFKDGEAPVHPTFYQQLEDLDLSGSPLPEATRDAEGFHFKLFMARALPNGERGLTVHVSAKGLQIVADRMDPLVNVPLLDVIAVDLAPGYLGILTRDRGVLKLEGIGSPQDRYLVQHLALALGALIKEEKNEFGN